MALVVSDRIKESTTTTGTGTVNLAGAETGFQTFVAGVGNSNTTYYAIVDAATGAFEVGTGTVTDASPDTLSRDTILQSSNSDSAVNFGSGTKSVFCTLPADKAVFEDASGNIAIPGTIDGRDLATDGTKLDGIESSATADQTAAEIRALVESASDSNVFTDNDHTKLNGIEASATADQTAAEIRTLVESASDSNVFTDADHSKLNGIEASADVTDATNVTAAGALMDSEVTNLSQVKAFDSSDYATAAQGTTADAALPKAGGTMTGDLVVNANASLDELSFNKSLATRFSTYYTGTSYITSGEYQKIATITPSGNSQNTYIRGIITAQSGQNIQECHFVASLRSNTLPDLAFTIVYHENMTSATRYIDLQLWTKETSPASFVLVAKGLAQIFGNITADFEFIPRYSSQDSTISVNEDPTSEVSSIDTGFTANDFTKITQSQAASFDVTGNITVSGTVDGRDIATDGTKLDGIEASADVTDTTNVTSAGALMDSEVTNLAQVKAFDSSDYATAAQGTKADAALPKAGGAMTGAITTNSTFDGRDVATDGTKLDGIEASATADQTAAEIRTLVESASDSNVFTDADHTKLNGVEASADVTDTTNVTSAGALMDSEVTNLAQVKAFDSSDYATAAQGTTADAALPKAGGTMTGNISRGDNVKSIYGAGNDLEIYHTGTNSIVNDVGTGNLVLSTNGTSVRIAHSTNAEAMAVFTKNGSALLNHDGSNKLETSSSGVDVTGNITVSGTVDGRDVAADGATADAALPKAGGTLTGNLAFGDNVKAKFGAGDDLQIYHDGSKSVIEDQGTGALQIRGTDLKLRSSAVEEYIQCIANGAVTLYYDNSSKLATTSSGVDVTGDIAVTGSMVFEGATADDHETTLAVTDPTADRTITLPDATGTVILNTNLNFPFFKADGSSDTIALTADSKLPFTKSDGSASNIALTT